MSQNILRSSKSLMNYCTSQSTNSSTASAINYNCTKYLQDLPEMVSENIFNKSINKKVNYVASPNLIRHPNRSALSHTRSGNYTTTTATAALQLVNSRSSVTRRTTPQNVVVGKAEHVESHTKANANSSDNVPRSMVNTPISLELFEKLQVLKNKYNQDNYNMLDLLNEYLMFKQGSSITSISPKLSIKDLRFLDEAVRI